MPLPLPTTVTGGLLSPRQVGAQIGRHPVVVIRYINEGRFPNAINNGGQGNGRRYGIPQSDVDNYLEARKIAAA